MGHRVIISFQIPETFRGLCAPFNDNQNSIHGNVVPTEVMVNWLGMNDEGDSRSIVYKLKNEWSLFWGSIAGDDFDGSKEANLDPEKVTLDDVRQLTRSLSEERQKLNQKLESLSREMDLNQAKLESMKLVGADPDEVVMRLQELSEEGQKLSEDLARFDDKLKSARDLEDQFRAEQIYSEQL